MKIRLSGPAARVMTVRVAVTQKLRHHTEHHPVPACLIHTLFRRVVAYCHTLPKTRLVYVQLEKLDNEVGTPVATMAPRHVERLNALAGTVGRNVVVPFMLLLRLASFFR